VILGHHALRFISRQKWHPPRFDEALEFTLRAIELDADADQRERPPRFLQEDLDRRALLASRHCAHRYRREAARLRLFHARNVGRQVEMHGTRHRLTADRESFAHLIECVLRGDRRRPLDQRTQQRLLVEYLVGCIAA